MSNDPTAGGGHRGAGRNITERDHVEGGAASGPGATGGAAQVTVNVKDDDTQGRAGISNEAQYLLDAVRSIVSQQTAHSDKTLGALSDTCSRIDRLDKIIFGNGHVGLVTMSRILQAVVAIIGLLNMMMFVVIIAMLI